MAVSETLVRECLEQRGLSVRQCRKYVTPHPGAEPDIDFLVVNPLPPAEPVTLPAVLEPADLSRLVRAVVAVRAWHTETFTPARLSHSPEVLRFVEPARLQRAVRALGPGPAPTRILVLPALPHTATLRRESLELLRARGVDAVLPSWPTSLNRSRPTAITRSPTCSKPCACSSATASCATRTWTCFRWRRDGQRGGETGRREGSPRGFRPIGRRNRQRTAILQDGGAG